MSDNPQSFNPDTTDLDRLHPAVKREIADVESGTEQAPMWVIFLGFIVAIIAGGQLGPNVGGFDFNVSNPFASTRFPDPRPVDGTAGAALDPLQLAMKKGAATYALCGGCHQGSGLGVPGAFPPLAGSDWVMGGTERNIRVVLHGLQGAIKVNGADFAGPAPMPAQGAVLSDQDVANVLTYVRNSWGNKGSLVTKEMVTAVREKEKARTAAWTAAELDPFAKIDVADAGK
jgi:mono/diheme cytochrome c family protein